MTAREPDAPDNYSATMGNLPLPAAFAVAEFDRVKAWVTANSEKPPGNIWFSFMSAWKAVAYRSKAAKEYSDALAQSLRVSTSPPEPERCNQDHDLFVFTMTALSAVECFYFAAYSLGHRIDPAALTMADAHDLRLAPSQIMKRLRQSSFGQEPLISEMAAVLTAPEYTQLKDFRDVLAHRGTPPRRAFFSNNGVDTPSTLPSNPRDPGGAWTYGTTIHDIPALNGWVESQVRRLITALDAFCQSPAVAFLSGPPSSATQTP